MKRDIRLMKRDVQCIKRDLRNHFQTHPLLLRATTDAVFIYTHYAYRVAKTHRIP